MSFGYVFEALKAHYRARGLTYSTVAKALRLFVDDPEQLHDHRPLATALH